jgi:predicted ATP-dependent endonuclease of OLD family
VPILGPVEHGERLFDKEAGFQVWCQMPTHLIQSHDDSLFLIDEPDIYLHSDLQRQLLQILRGLGPDILIATHSTEIINEAERDDIVLINKARNTGRRVREPSELRQVFAALGSNTNPILTQLAKTRRALFVEGDDFQILGRFAQKLGLRNVAARSDFAVVPVGGFNPERIIPRLVDQNRWAHSRRPMDMIVHGWSTSLFQA